MNLSTELKKPTSFIDLAIQAGRKRQGARSQMVHDGEAIALYENFCFAFALFRHKSTESVLEGRALIERLLAFQAPDGNFPIYLHDFPRCFDPHMALKIAPILIYVLRQFGSLLGELKSRVQAALEQILSRPTSWENRYRACTGQPLLPHDPEPHEWTEWLITAQLAGQTHFSLPYDAEHQLFLGCEHQEKGEPRPSPIEWLLADGHFSPRLLRDHPHQILCAPLFPISVAPQLPPAASFRLFWQGATLHSLSAPSLIFDLPLPAEPARGDLYEAALFCDISSETTIFVKGQRATSFQLGDLITIQTPGKTIALRFELTQGSGDFCGHISRSNRPSQICKGYESYDWRIGLRTLRRPCPAQVSIVIDSV